MRLLLFIISLFFAFSLSANEQIIIKELPGLSRIKIPQEFDREAIHNPEIQKYLLEVCGFPAEKEVVISIKNFFDSDDSYKVIGCLKTSSQRFVLIAYDQFYGQRFVLRCATVDGSSAVEKVWVPLRLQESNENGLTVEALLEERLPITYAVVIEGLKEGEPFEMKLAFGLQKRSTFLRFKKEEPYQFVIGSKEGTPGRTYKLIIRTKYRGSVILKIPAEKIVQNEITKIFGWEIE